MSLAGILALPLSAQARPGTPKGVLAYECFETHRGFKYRYQGPPALCIRFTNTASEDVKFDIESYVNDRKLPNGALRSHARCPNPRINFPFHCTFASDFGGTNHATNAEHYNNLFPEEVMLRNLEWATKYCFRLKARDAANGMVSEVWSNTACYTTPSEPAKPLTPKVDISLTPASFDELHQRQVPAKVHVSYDGAGDQVVEYSLSATSPGSRWETEIGGLFAHADHFSGQREVELPLGLTPASRRQILVVACASNMIGKTCSRPTPIFPPGQFSLDLTAERDLSVSESVARSSPAIIFSNPSPIATAVLACKTGFVPRRAGPQDTVCAPPASRDRSQMENTQAASLRNPAGPHGPNSCKEGYVWREAFAGDAVCVTPQTRDLVR